MKKKQFLVVGLGRFGSSMTRTLVDNGHEVLAVDKDAELVQDIAPYATHAVQADCTDEVVLKQLGVSNFTHAIVAIGDDLQASILTTLMLKEMNIPIVITKARDEMHGNVLRKIGADKIIYPERDMAVRLANQLSSNSIIDYIELSDEYNIVEMLAPAAMIGLSLQKLNIRARFGCTILAIKTEQRMNIAPSADDKIEAGNILLVIGSQEQVLQLEKYYERKK
ncbi:potassium channel family protein [Paenibacillus camelliae]|uniref:potassium channel family protein n=1 Tax=Paenibacillus camelliae TaxID=512410 RepID=UPI00203D3253|nr:TrkA family potassium uptake protein [Paenibacillus camelliae]MCM3635597.1 TrkA family potassium uptake protein [Paenibacillus camelliae]